MSEENKIEKIKYILNNIQQQIDLAKKIISGQTNKKKLDTNLLAREIGAEKVENNIKVIEGVFSGDKMIGPDGKEYLVPQNYASKSKLVEGDMLKLTIQPNGAFVFKQIGPVPRERVVGKIFYDEEKKQFYGRTEHTTYKLLSAAVTYFKGENNDEVIMLTPKNTQSTWAAVENIIKKS